MAVQYSDAVNNARLAAIETTIGASPTLEFRTGAPPANTATADSGVLVASLALPADWLAAPAGAQVSKLGTWEDPAADNAGIIAHYRIKQGAVTHEQGTVGEAGSGADMIVDNANVKAGQLIAVATYTKTAGNR